jgi:hypothetical protein
MYLTPYQLEAVKKGILAARPDTDAAGQLYYATDTQELYLYTNQGWILPAVPPAIPTSVVATNTGSARAFNNARTSLTFTQPGTAGVATSYLITAVPVGGGTTVTTTGSASPIAITGLLSNTSYTYTVTANNSYGQMVSATTSSILSTTIPQPPTITSIDIMTASLQINATVGATGGAATTYSIVSNPATTTKTTSTFPYVFTGLTNGTSYTFTITATNSNGSAAPVTSSSASPVLAYAIGATGPGGGIVFYDAGSYLSWGRFLEAATTDITTDRLFGYPWNAGFGLSLSSTLGSGYNNTVALANAGSGPANACRNYTGGGFTDWFMPDLDMLNTMFGLRTTIGNFKLNGDGAPGSNGGWYLSSTYGGGDRQNCVYFTNGYNSALFISDFTCRVRAVRAF